MCPTLFDAGARMCIEGSRTQLCPEICFKIVCVALLDIFGVRKRPTRWSIGVAIQMLSNRKSPRLTEVQRSTFLACDPKKKENSPLLSTSTGQRGCSSIIFHSPSLVGGQVRVPSAAFAVQDYEQPLKSLQTNLLITPLTPTDASRLAKRTLYGETGDRFQQVFIQAKLYLVI